MISFKKWLTIENLAGPGGGPDSVPINQVALNQNISQHGAGAFPKGGDNPPPTKKTATSNYVDRRFARGDRKQN